MKKNYTANVQEPYFAFIKKGIKIVEGRLNKGKFLEMRIGDEILLNEVLKVEIVNKTNYKTFREMVIFEGIKNVVPDAKNIDEAESAYYKHFTNEDEILFGVVAIQIKII